MIVVSIFVVLLSLVVLSIHALRRKMSTGIPLKGKTNVPGLTTITWPFIGDSLWFFGMREAAELGVQCWKSPQSNNLYLLGGMKADHLMSPTVSDLWSIVTKLFAMRDRAFTFWLGPKILICVKDPTIFETLLRSSKCLNKDAFLYAPFGMFFDGLFSKNGKVWSDYRKPLNKLLHPTVIQSYAEVFATKATELCKNLDTNCDKGTFNLQDYVKYCTIDIILETVMGVPGTQMKKNTLNFPNIMHQAIHYIFQKVVRVEYRFDWIFEYLGPGRAVRKLNKQLSETSRYILECRRKEYADKGISPYDPGFEPANYSDAVIQVINNGELPYNHKRYEAFVDVILAGYDTTSITVSTACLYLALHPDYQEKVYKEQVDIMGESLEPPTIEQLSTMNYLTMVYHETMRKVGVPGVVRTVTSQIEVEGFVFPEGSSVYFAITAMSTDPEYWERPNEFYPDHFLPEFTAKRPKGAFLPFSSGARSCPGKAFANSSVKIMLSMLLRRYRFTTPLKYEELTYDYAIMLESAKGYPVEITRRVK